MRAQKKLVERYIELHRAIGGPNFRHRNANVNGDAKRMRAELKAIEARFTLREREALRELLDADENGRRETWEYWEALEKLDETVEQESSSRPEILPWEGRDKP